MLRRPLAITLMRMATSNVRDDLDESESKYYSDTDFRNQMLHAHDDGTYGTVDAVFGDAYEKSLE